MSKRDLPLQLTGNSIDEDIKIFAWYGTLAPSTHNTQPWVFKIRHSKLEILPDTKRRLPIADPVMRHHIISLGACTENVLLAARAFGYTAKIVKQGISGITLQFKAPGTKRQPDVDLLSTIARRHSHKFDYNGVSPLPHHLSRLAEVKVPGIAIELIQEPSVRNKIAMIQQREIQKLGVNTDFGREISGWLRTNSGRHVDGMPGAVMGIKGPVLLVAREAIRRVPKVMNVLARRDRQLLEAGPLLAVVIAKGDTPLDWVSAGRAYEAISIACESVGLKSAPLSAIIENPSAARELASIIGVKRGVPQMLLRIGYSAKQPYYTPRRPLSEVIQ